MSLKSLGWSYIKTKPLTFEEVADSIDDIVGDLGGEVNSRAVLATVVVLLERIESLEKRLEANGIYE